MVERVKQISQQTGVSLVLVLALGGICFQAGAVTQRVGSLEYRSDRTARAIEELATLATRMDRRLTLLEERQARPTATHADLDAPDET